MGSYKEEVRTFLIHYECDECKNGTLRLIEGLIHRCDSCKKDFELERPHPYLEYKVISFDE